MTTNTTQLEPRERITSACERTIFWSLVALVVALPLAFNPWGEAYFDSPKMLVVRTLAMVVAAAWAVRAIVTARLSWVRTALDWPLAAYFASACIATLFALDRHTSFYGAINTFDGVINLACYIVLAYAAVNFVHTRAQLRILVFGALGAASLVSLIAVLERLGLYVLPSPLAPGIDPTRSAAAFGNPIHLAAYLALTLPITVAVALWLRVRADEEPSERASVLVWSATAAAGLQAAALLATQGRAAWLGALVGVAVVLVGHATARGISAPRHLTVPLAIIATAVLLYAGVGAVGRGPSGQSVTERTRSVAAAATGTAFNRLYLWKMTLPMIAARPLHGSPSALDARLGAVRLPAQIVRPLFGYGMDQYLQLFPKWRPADWYRAIEEDAVPAQPHNDFLQVAVWQGLVGLVAYLVVLGVFFVTVPRAAMRSTQLLTQYCLAGLLAATLAYIIQIQLSFAVVGVAPLFWLSVGLAISFAHSDQRAGRIAELKLPTGGGGVQAAVIAVVAVLVAWGALGLYDTIAADTRLRAAQVALARGEFDAALEALNASVAANPCESRFPMLAARYCEEVFIRTRNEAYADAGLSFARTAQRLDPLLTSPYFTEASIYRDRAGRTGTAPLQAAARIYRRILAVDPHNEDALFNLGLTLYDLEDYQAAQDALAQATDLKPDDGDAYEALGATFVKLRSYDKARAALERAVTLKPASTYVRQQLEQLKKRDTTRAGSR